MQMRSSTGWISFVVLLATLFPGSWERIGAEDLRIVVTEGDNLATLSEKYLDEPGDWLAVARANGLKDPHLIHPGQELVIPAHLLKGVPAMGRANFVKGDVQIMAPPEDGWRPLDPGEEIPPGSRIRTGAEGFLEMTFEDGSVCFVKPGASLRILRARKRGIDHYFRDFMLELGRIVARLQRATGSGSRWNIRTPSATAAARGTEFRVSADERRDTRVEVLEGTVGAMSRGRGVTLEEGEGTLIRRGRAPMEPRRLLDPPVPDSVQATYNKLPLEFRFHPVPGAAGFRILLAVGPELRDIVREVRIEPGGSARMTDLEDGEYYVYAQTVDSLGLEGPPSEPVRVRLRTNPVPPFIQYPTDGAEHKATAVVFKWLNVEDAESYHLQVSEGPDFAVAAEEQDNIRGVEFKTDKLAPGKYFFRIRSTAADGYRGAWSDTQSFTILPPPPVPPAEPPRSDRKHLYMRWQDLGEGMRYHFQMSADKEFRTIVQDAVVERPEITVDKPRKSGTYYVRVSGVAPDGYEGRFSPTQSFKIKRFPYGILGAAVTVTAFVLIIVL